MSSVRTIKLVQIRSSREVFPLFTSQHVGSDVAAAVCSRSGCTVVLSGTSTAFLDEKRDAGRLHLKRTNTAPINGFIEDLVNDWLGGLSITCLADQSA